MTSGYACSDENTSEIHTKEANDKRRDTVRVLSSILQKYARRPAAPLSSLQQGILAATHALISRRIPSSLEEKAILRMYICRPPVENAGMHEKIEHSVSYHTIITLVLVCAGIFLAFKLADIIFLVIVALMLAAALNPLVRRLATRMPLSVSATIVVFGILLPVVAVLAIGIPNVVQQGPDILNQINQAVHSSPLLPPALRATFNLNTYVQQAGHYLLQSAATITTLITTVFSVIFLTIYLLIDRVHLRKLLLALVPRDYRKQTQEMMQEFALVSGRYIRGNLIISVICSIFIFIGLFFLGVPNALLLAVFAGMMDLLPLIGSLIGALPAVILAFTLSPTTGVLVLGLFLIYQQIENHILAPNIYNKALNLSPVFSFLAVIAGAVLYGIPGAFIALPLAASVPALVEFIQQYEAAQTE